MRFVSFAAALLMAAAAAAQTTFQQDRSVFMPGSQPGSVNLTTSTWCDNCHGDYDPAIEPGFNWRGSMMAQAGRDPLWLAAMTVAEQDSLWVNGNTNGGSICLRCHAPAGWLGGRAEPVNGTKLTAQDHEGVLCDLCHRMVDPMRALRQPDVTADAAGSAAATQAQKTYDADLTVLAPLTLSDGSPFFDRLHDLPRLYSSTISQGYGEAAGGQYFVDPADVRRGPRADPLPMHVTEYSRFHRSRAFCGTCHDVSNAPMANVLHGAGTSERRAAAGYMHLERTFSEFMSSEFARNGGRCQDCHMPRVRGGSTLMPNVPARSDLAKHDLTGGNAWISGMLATVDQGSLRFDPYNYAILSGQKYGAKIDVAGLQGFGDALSAGSQRARAQLGRAASLRLVSAGAGELRLRIQNDSGHKLISGFPEGRRMWLNVKFYDANGALIGEINPYAALVTTRDAAGNEQYVSGGDLTVTNDDLVYEARMSSSVLSESDSFHFALVTGRTKDNRIPPRGFDLAMAAERLSLPRANGADAPALFTAEEYAGGYDEVRIATPAGTTSWRATLYYQTTSKAYVEFLRDEISGAASSLHSPTPAGAPSAYVVQSDPFFAPLRGWGRAMWDLWLHNGGAAPVAISTLSAAEPRRRAVGRR